MICKKPFISIVTVSYNAISTIEKTILSVITQTYSNIEYIIIDGGSTDGTVDIIRRYSADIHYWISEPDRGIYDAMNKGVDQAKGDYIFFLGDDILIDSNILLSIFMPLSCKYDFLYGNVKYSSGYMFVSKFTSKILLHNTIHHQGAFYGRHLFSNFRYDTKLKLISDYELNLLIYLKRRYLKICRLNRIVALCEEGGRSRVNICQSFRETNSIRSRYMNFFLNLLLYGLYFMKYLLSYVRYK